MKNTATMAQLPVVHVIDDSSVRMACARLLDAAPYRGRVYASGGAIPVSVRAITAGAVDC